MTSDHRKPLIAANWKMFPQPDNLDSYKPRTDIDIVVFPTFLDLKACIAAGLTVGGQCGRPEDSGAFTGDVSLNMLKDLGCTYVLCGHSERRREHGETNESVASQVAAALKHGLHPIVCIGETEEERNTGKEKDVVRSQLQAILEHLWKLEIGNWKLEIAYEPVWAIGTGNTATPKDAQEMHAFIRRQLVNCPLSIVNCRILYGGSVKPENAEELLNQPDIDGALVGGASLDPEKFAAIVGVVARRNW